MKKREYCLFILLVSAVCFIGARPPSKVILVKLEDNIHSVSAQFITQSIDKADRDRAELVVVQLHTPGGLDQAMRDIITKILNSSTPIAVYVAPSGARAASAGFFIVVASDIAAMAPGTNTGAAHPVPALPFVQVEETEMEKVVKDVVAYMSSIVAKRGRNVELVEKAITESRSYTPEEALQGGLIDYISGDMPELLKVLNGKKVTKFNGQEVTLNLDSYIIEEMEMTFRQRVLSAISQPFLTFILLAIGLIGLYYELTHPGLVLPGVLGAICLVLAFFAFQILPVNYAGLVLIFLAIIFFILEVKVTSYGMLTVAGIISMIFGSMMLISGPIPEMRIPLKLIIPISLAIAFITTFLLRLVVVAHRKRVTTGGAGLIGEIGVVTQELKPEGKVFIHGEIWKAVVSKGGSLPKGSKVKVVRVKGLTIEVEGWSESSHLSP
ncbi:MAG: nodulation protein NfeD [Candidatus Aminicenantes bacterium]|nr:nodulation protein NfeD [Candidatus Aminicenantes bacterium]